MDIILIILLSISAVAAVTAMVLAHRKGKCASCPYYDSCPRLNYEDRNYERDDENEGYS